MKVEWKESTLRNEQAQVGSSYFHFLTQNITKPSHFLPGISMENKDEHG